MRKLEACRAQRSAESRALFTRLFSSPRLFSVRSRIFPRCVIFNVTLQIARTSRESVAQKEELRIARARVCRCRCST